MIKKIIIIGVVIAAIIITALNILSKKAPDLLKDAIEKALNKKVTIAQVEYSFPGTFRLEGFKIEDNNAFAGEPSFYAEEIRLDVSPLSFSQKTLLIDKISVENASIILRQSQGRLTHALSDALPKGPSANTNSSSRDKNINKAGLPLVIKNFSLKKSSFKFIDYDVDVNGFVLALADINADITDIVLPISSQKTGLTLKARMPQAREERPAEVYANGWTRFDNLDSDLSFGIEGLYLPMFKPYYSKVTYAVIDSGYLSSKANIHIDKKELTLNMDLEATSLFFQSYESDNQLFGLKAEEILSFLRDRSGKLKLQVTARWNIADRSIKAKNVIRKSIEHSLKNIVLSNVGNILENAIQKLGEGGIDKTKDKVEETVKKIKDFFKY